VVGPHLIYQYQTPVFLMTGDFFKQCLVRPGGPAEYASLFLSQFCYYPWLGALIIAAVAWCICRLTRSFLKRVAGGEVSPWLSHLPAVFLLMLHGQYDYRMLPSVAILVALLFVNLYVHVGWSVPRRATLFAGMTVLLYWLAGGICVLFGALCGVFELVVNRRLALGALLILCAPVAPLAFALGSYGVDSSEAFVNLHPFRSVYMTVDPASNAPSLAVTRMLSLLERIHFSLML
jgi:hypothetical protein